jgi:hypothetical protein
MIDTPLRALKNVLENLLEDVSKNIFLAFHVVVEIRFPGFTIQRKRYPVKQGSPSDRPDLPMY